MDEQRQHLEHEEIPVKSQPDLQILCDATASIDGDRWVEDTAIDRLNEEELGKLEPAIKSLFQSCKLPRLSQYNVYRFKQPKIVAPTGLDIVIPLHKLGNTKPMLSEKELVIGNIYWIRELASIQPDVVLLWLGSPRKRTGSLKK